MAEPGNAASTFLKQLGDSLANQEGVDADLECYLVAPTDDIGPDSGFDVERSFVANFRRDRKGAFGDDPQ
jgi:hypothetical protein